MKQYVLKHGESLRTIAQTELGDADRWQEIVELNSLSYPFITASPSTGTITPGDTIYLPETEEEFVETEVPVFGTDILLSGDKFNITVPRGGDFLVSDDGDYRLVSGIPCVHQDYAHRLMTSYGSLPYHPFYGSIIPDLIGSKKGSTWRTKTELEIERVLRADDRISDVPVLNVVSTPTGISINSTAVANRVPYNINEVIT